MSRVINYSGLPPKPLEIQHNNADTAKLPKASQNKRPDQIATFPIALVRNYKHSWLLNMTKN